MTYRKDIHGRDMVYELRKQQGINKCYDCGEIIEQDKEYYRITKPQGIDVCEKCGKRRGCK